MKFNLVGKATLFLLGAAVLVTPGSLHAGWGILRGGSSGGSTGFGSGGSAGSVGYSASYASGGSSGGYTASYSSVGGGSSGVVAYGSGGSSGGPGILQRVASRIHDHLAAKHARHAARRAAYGSSGGSAGYGSSGGYTSYASVGGGSSGGSSGGYATSYSSYSGGSSGGGSVSYGSSGVSYGSTGAGVSYGSTGYSSGVSYGSTGYSSGLGSSGDVYYGASTSQADTSSLVSNVRTDNDAVYLSVAVPNDAKVFVNDDATKSSGAVRKFVSHGLEPGKQYRFVVRAELTGADGKLMTEEKTVLVSAGQQEDVQFAFSESKTPVETAITLNLPEGAKVLLAGNETKAIGETRTYRTSRLKVGELWDDYEIEVQYEGKVKRQSVRLVGGDKLQLTFNFEQDAANLAAR